MSAARRWTLQRGPIGVYALDEGSPIAERESVEAIEAAPVEAELERLREIESAAREFFAVSDGAYISAHPAGASAVRKAEADLRSLLEER